MQSIIKLSSSLSSQTAVDLLRQTKDYTVKLASNASLLGKTSSRQKTAGTEVREEANALLEFIKAECSNGLWAYDPAGPYHNFLQHAEDIVLTHILIHGGDFEAFCKCARSVADHLSVSIDETAIIYSCSAISSIRVIMKLVASVRPMILFKFVDMAIEALMKTNDKMKPFEIDRYIRTFTRQLDASLPRNLNIAPFLDDVFGNVLILSWEVLPSYRETGIQPRSISIRVNGAGFEPLNEAYVVAGTPATSGTLAAGVASGSPATAGDDMTFVSSSGYRISKESVLLHNQYSNYDIGGEDNSKLLYIWTIASASLQATYYTCCTNIRSQLPPARGWRRAKDGKLPVPTLSMEENAEDSCIRNTGQPIASSLFPAVQPRPAVSFADAASSEGAATALIPIPNPLPRRRSRRGSSIKVSVTDRDRDQRPAPLPGNSKFQEDNSTTEARADAGIDGILADEQETYQQYLAKARNTLLKSMDTYHTTSNYPLSDFSFRFSEKCHTLMPRLQQQVSSDVAARLLPSPNDTC